MKLKLIAFYSIFIGVSVIAMWVLILSTEVLPEGKTELSFHLISEFLMALICLISGIQILRRSRLGKLLNITGLGMVLYSVLNAAGYYGEKNDLAMMIFFMVLFILTFIVLLLHFSAENNMQSQK